MDEPLVGSLVKLSIDSTSTGMIIQFLSDEDVVVLWSTPPPFLRKRYGEIWWDCSCETTHTERDIIIHMSDRNLIATCCVVLLGVLFYNVVSLRDGDMTSPLPATSASQPQSTSIASEDCQDCLSVVPGSCEYEYDSCQTHADCSSWMGCVEDCVAVNADLSCYDDCDLAHSDVHSECQSLKTCACDVCVGQCVDMCMADDWKRVWPDFITGHTEKIVEIILIDWFSYFFLIVLDVQPCLLHEVLHLVFFFSYRV